jgi:hypothetical protein
MACLNRCECYFTLRSTSENQRVLYASFYLLDDAQLWYHMLELNGGLPSWNHFVQLIHTCFGLSCTESSIGELTLLSRDGSVESFYNRFMALSCRDLEITEAHQIQLFMVGLGQPLRTPSPIVQPTKPAHHPAPRFPHAPRAPLPSCPARLAMDATNKEKIRHKKLITKTDLNKGNILRVITSDYHVIHVKKEESYHEVTRERRERDHER